MKLMIYDCEIIRAIPPKNPEERLDGIDYCEGWRDFEHMGIAVIGAYDYFEDRYRVFLKDNAAEFQDLLDRSEIIAGFNSLGFDNPLCRANGVHVEDGLSYDLLAEIWAGAGLSRSFEYPSHAGFGLDACCAANFGEYKSGHGALAPVDWQRGNIGRVIDYCANDVRLTKLLLDQIMRCGYIRDPRDPARLIEVAPPQCG